MSEAELISQFPAQKEYADFVWMCLANHWGRIAATLVGVFLFGMFIGKLLFVQKKMEEGFFGNFYKGETAPKVQPSSYSTEESTSGDTPDLSQQL